ncbi:hypothetical protein C8D92_105193 [Tamilnaduibacter salinus]|uniref:Uncharacterized protein n=1 Tax=Tamilnaduibacter salinus TaxID=1484056 RepID=A0A2U1CWT0_9GAMM|nr:hypothetical protein [Tamilnaduibacter salinus]PVY76440.1 hypothetical protein C8D92_105193 [Tamilnaduibacter salinus]
MNHEQREYIAAAINFFWPGMTQPHTVNESAARVLYEALSEAQACTASVDLVPSPTLSPPGITYIIKTLATIGRKMLSGDAGIYSMCRDQVAASYKTRMALALRGI